MMNTLFRHLTPFLSSLFAGVRNALFPLPINAISLHAIRDILIRVKPPVPSRVISSAEASVDLAAPSIRITHGLAMQPQDL